MLKELDIITAENFVTDEDIQGQNFMTDDISAMRANNCLA